MLWLIVSIVVLLALGVCFYKMMMSPQLRYHSIWYKMKAAIVFWLGDIRRLNKFPWATWASKYHRLTYKQMREAALICRPGDVGLHRDEGFLSNVAIPGAFKHAWIVVENEDCVEAVSEGVIKRDCMAPLITDYAIILRPIGTNKAEVNRAVRRANGIVGSSYDVNFNFNFEETDSNLKEKERSFTRNLDAGKFHAAFSCTETVGYSWYHCSDKLRLFRSHHAGREAIIADDFLKMNFGIVWVSPSVTMEWLKESGMHEEGRKKIEDFRDGKKDFNEHGNPIPRRI
jgi:hypothetical protein